MFGDVAGDCDGKSLLPGGRGRGDPAVEMTLNPWLKLRWVVRMLVIQDLYLLLQ